MYSCCCLQGSTTLPPSAASPLASALWIGFNNRCMEDKGDILSALFHSAVVVGADTAELASTTDRHYQTSSDGRQRPLAHLLKSVEWKATQPLRTDK